MIYAHCDRAASTATSTAQPRLRNLDRATSTAQPRPRNLDRTTSTAQPRPHNLDRTTSTDLQNLRYGSNTAVHFDCCGNPLSTYRLRKLMQHLQEHFTGELLLPCIELACQKEFESLPKLRRHVNNQHPNAAYKVDTQAGSMKKRVHGADHPSSKRQRTLRKDRSQGSNLSNQHPQRRKETLDDLSICASKYIGAAKEAVKPFLDLGYESQPVTN
jgi:hypothetical protein